MRKILGFVTFGLAFGLATGAAQAQIKCWNEGGKRVCGDAPPAGAKVTTIRAPSGGEPAPAAAAKDGAPDAKKGPLTPAEKEADYQKRQAEAQKAAEKTALEKKNQEAKAENCERAKAALRPLESGQRIARTNASGERYFLDDAQIAQELAAARQTAQEACGK